MAADHPAELTPWQKAWLWVVLLTVVAAVLVRIFAGPTTDPDVGIDYEIQEPAADTCPVAFAGEPEALRHCIEVLDSVGAP